MTGAGKRALLPSAQTQEQQQQRQELVDQLVRQDSWIKEFITKCGDSKLPAVESVDSSGPTMPEQYTLRADLATDNTAVLTTATMPCSEQVNQQVPQAQFKPTGPEQPGSPRNSFSFSELSDVIKNLSEPCTPERTQLAAELSSMALSPKEENEVALDISAFFNLPPEEIANSSRYYGDGIPIPPGMSPKDVVKLWLENNPALTQNYELSTKLVGIRQILEEETGSYWGKAAVSLGCSDKDLVFFDSTSGVISCAVSPEWRTYLRDQHLPAGPLPRPISGLEFTDELTGIWWIAHKGIMSQCRTHLNF